MGTRRDRIRLVAVAASYGAAFVAAQRVMPFPLDSPWFVLVAMVCFLGLAAMARRVVRLTMPGPLRRIRAWEVEGGVYRALAVPAFGTLLRRSPLRFLNTDVYLKGGARRLDTVMAELEAAETSHFWAAILVVPYMVRAALLEKWSVCLWFLLVQGLANVYPVMHLRLARHRLEHMTSRERGV
jgi:Glycosyl-4,4'-diaponeurosporenoate acyltransferase